MNNKRSYPSRYAKDTLVTAAQYITEFICEKKAKLDTGDLPQQFWKQDKWAMFFRNQVTAANSLLKYYDAAAIIKALHNPAAYKIFSLRAPHLIDIIKGEQSKLEVLEEKRKASVPLVCKDTMEKPRPPQKTRTNISKLRDLDYGEEEEK